MHHPPHILLIDDDDVDVMIFKRALKRSGIEHTLSVAYDGDEALEQLRGEASGKPLQPDVILMDVNMPRMNGHECLSALRADPRLKRNVVFMFTTSSDRNDVERAFDHNVAGFITKTGQAEQCVQIAQMVDQYAQLTLSPY
ncbi:MAG: response regulator [Bradymonadia bacterium]